MQELFDLLVEIFPQMVFKKNFFILSEKIYKHDKVAEHLAFQSTNRIQNSVVFKKDYKEDLEKYYSSFLEVFMNTEKFFLYKEKMFNLSCEFIIIDIKGRLEYNIQINSQFVRYENRSVYNNDDDMYLKIEIKEKKL